MEHAEGVTAAETPDVSANAGSGPANSSESSSATPHVEAPERASSLREGLAQAFTDAGKQAPAQAEAAPVSEQARKLILDEGRKAASAEYQRKFGLTDKSNPEQFRAAMTFAGRYQTNRSDVEREVIAAMLANPESAAALRALIGGNGNGNGRGPAVAETKQRPSPFIERDGQHYVNPEWEEHLKRTALEEFAKEIAPLKENAEKLRKREEAIALDQKVQSGANESFGYLKTLPDFEENRAEIGKLFGEMCVPFENEERPWPSPEGLSNLALRAYNTVVHPKLASSAQARVQADLKLKAQGRTASPNGNGKSSVTVSDKSESERLRAALHTALVDPTTGQLLK